MFMWIASQVSGVVRDGKPFLSAVGEFEVDVTLEVRSQLLHDDQMLERASRCPFKAVFSLSCRDTPALPPRLQCCSHVLGPCHGTQVALQGANRLLHAVNAGLRAAGAAAGQAGHHRRRVQHPGPRECEHQLHDGAPVEGDIGASSDRSTCFASVGGLAKRSLSQVHCALRGGSLVSQWKARIDGLALHRIAANSRVPRRIWHFRRILMY